MRYFENAVVMLPLAAILAAIIYCPFFFVLRKKQLPIIKHIANYVFTGYAVMLLWVVFFWAGRVWNANGTGLHNINLQPFSEIIYAYTEDGGAWSSQVMWNVFMFIPLGFLLPCVFQRLRKGAWKTILLCLAITICIETLQYLVGRTADIDDVLTNLVGGVFGHAVYVIVAKWFANVSWTSSILVDSSEKYRPVLAWIVVGLTLGVPTICDIVLHII